MTVTNDSAVAPTWASEARPSSRRPALSTPGSVTTSGRFAAKPSRISPSAFVTPGSTSKERVEWNWGACGGDVPNREQTAKTDFPSSAYAACGAYAALPRLTAEAIREWPPSVPTVFLSFDIGFWVRSGGVLQAAPERSPCRRAYELFCGIRGGGGALPKWCDDHGRNAWE